MASGEVVLTQTDVELPGLLPLVVSRSHISSYRAGISYGRSWASSLDRRLVIEGDTAIYASGDGMLLSYSLSPSSSPPAPVMPEEGPRLPLERVDDGFTVTDPALGHVMRFAGGNARSDDAAGARVLPLTSITDRNGNRLDFDRRGDHSVARIRGSSGYRVAVDYEDGRVRALRLLGDDEDRSGRVVVRYGYNDDGDLAEVVDSSGEPHRFRYDGEGRLTGWDDRVGCWYRYHYDDEGRCVATEGPGGHLSATFAYLADGRRTVMTNSLGQATTFRMNDRGQVVAVTDPAGNVTVAEWDRRDRLLAVVDPLGRTERYRYDDQGNLSEIVRADGRRATVAYDALDLPTVITEADGSVWRQEHDDRGNLLACTNALGAVTRYTYDERGRLTSITDALGRRTEVVTDDTGLPVKVTDPAGAITRWAHDEFGRPTEITWPAGETVRLGWTDEGNLEWRSLPGGGTERWTYDAEGNVTAYTDAAGHVTRTEYTGFELVSARVGPDGARLEFGHDTELRLTSVTDARGLVWRYEYDAAGNLVAETDFDGRELRYAYDAAGRLIARTNGAGQIVRYTRDAMGDIVRQVDGDGEVTTFDHDPAGRLVRARNADADLRLDRDALGQVVVEECNGQAVHQRFDPLGRRIWRRTPSGVETHWRYGPGGRLVSLETAGQVLRFGHDDSGRETARTIAGGMTLTCGWDAAHRLRSQTLWRPPPTGERRAGTAGDPVWHRTYTYRTDGHLTAVDDSLSGRRRFDLDPAGRVTAVHARERDERYVYDAAGNLTEARWPGRDETARAPLGPREYADAMIRRAGRVTFEHDAQGRVVRRRERSLSGRLVEWRYAWDADDRLTAVITPGGERWRYRYDPLGRRIAKQRLAPGSGHVVEQTDFAWDDVVLAERTRTVPGETGTGSRTTTWEYEPGTFRPMTQVDHEQGRGASPERTDHAFYAIVTDLVGTPTEMVDPRGEVVWRRGSSLWGAPTVAGETDEVCPLRFPNHHHDPETGLDYNYFRYYDPATARYQSADPLGIADSPNPYAYVSNPFHGMDPLGLFLCVHPRPDGQHVFAGHANFTPKNGYTTVPHGTAICFYSKHGRVLTDWKGLRIEKGRPGVKPVETFTAGQRVPNYTLYPPGDLGTVEGLSHTVDRPTHLSQLLDPNMGRVHWAACRNVAR
ncbi:putative adhesin [Actinoallomurus acaciae]|uniref:Adhesin n=1 Tax=Actinoallomurus acaciae TaxID=502577 RepID=A0ABV5YQM9_9ACTN